MPAFRTRILSVVMSPEFLCVAVGLALRWTWFNTAQGESFFYAHVQDSALYHELAQRILNEGLPLSEPFSVAPLYAFFLAGMYRLVGVDPTMVYIAQVLISLLTIWMTCRLGRQLFGMWGAFVGGLGLALYPAAILYDVRLLSVALGTAFTVATALFAHRAWLTGRLGFWALAGLLLGVGALVRGNLLLVAPFILALAWLRGTGVARYTSMLAVFLGLSLGVGPSAWHNHVAGEGFVPVSLGGGINLYRGNNAHFVDAAVHPFRLPPQRDGLLRKSQLIASVENDRQLTSSEADRYWLGKTIMAWYDQPVRAVGITIRKMTQVLASAEIGDHMNLEQMASRNGVLDRIPPFLTPLSALALLGLLVTRRPRDAGVATVLMASVGSVALFFVVSRYRAPIVPLLAIYAGGGLQWMWSQLKARGRRPLIGSVVGVLATTVALDAPAVDDRLPWNWLAAEAEPAPDCAIDRHVMRDPNVEDLFHVGAFALNHRRFVDAEEAMWSVLRADETHTAAGVNLSWLLLQKGAIKESAAIAERVLEVDACDDKAWSNLATARLRMGQYDAALKAAQRASAIDPYNPGYDSILGEATLAKGDKAAARPLFEKALRWQPDLWQAKARLGRIALEEARYEDASRYLQAAVRAQPNRQELVGFLGLAEIGRGNEEGARKLLQAAVKSGLRGPALTGLARALSQPSGP